MGAGTFGGGGGIGGPHRGEGAGCWGWLRGVPCVLVTRQALHSRVLSVREEVVNRQWCVWRWVSGGGCGAAGGGGSAVAVAREEEGG